MSTVLDSGLIHQDVRIYIYIYILVYIWSTLIKLKSFVPIEQKYACNDKICEGSP